MPATQRLDQGDRTAIVPNDALRGFFHIIDAWGVSADDARVLLGSPAERTYYAWRQGNAVRVPMDTLRRVGYIAGIYKALANRLLGRASGRQLGQTPEQSIWRAEPSRSHEGRRRRRSGGRSKLCGRGASAVELKGASASRIRLAASLAHHRFTVPADSIVRAPDARSGRVGRALRLGAAHQSSRPRRGRRDRARAARRARVGTWERAMSWRRSRTSIPGDRGSATAASASTMRPRSSRRPLPRQSFISKNLRGIAAIRCEPRTCASSSAE